MPSSAVVIVLFVWKFIPETKGKSLEEIEIELVGLPSIRRVYCCKEPRMRNIRLSCC